MRSGLACVLMILAGVAPPSAAAEATVEFSWEARSAFEGNLTFEVSIRVVEPATCTVQAQFSGRIDPPQTILMWWFDDLGHSGGWSSVSAGGIHGGGLVHVGPVPVMTNPLEGPGHWVVGDGTERRVEDVARWTWSAFNLKAWHPQVPSPASMKISCGAPFEVVDLAGSTQAIGRQPGNLDGGPGVSAATSNFLGPNVHVLSSVDAVFSTQRVRFHYFDHPSACVVAGNLRLDQPDGVQEWTYVAGLKAVGFGPFQANAVSGPGAYRVELSRLAVGVVSDFELFLLGLQSVTSLDDVA